MARDVDDERLSEIYAEGVRSSVRDVLAGQYSPDSEHLATLMAKVEEQIYADVHGLRAVWDAAIEEVGEVT